MLEGLLLVNKPSGPSSYDLIRWIKRKIKDVNPKPKIGHCGTLDPLASGLMLILLGKATKKQGQLMGFDKTYLCELILGCKTDSGDITGTTVATGPKTIDSSLLSLLGAKFIGSQSQIPPMYSAIKINGTSLYKLARKGQTIERQPRPITVHSLEILGHSDDVLTFRVSCSSGTYVRVLVEEMGEALGTVATMKSLVREKVGPYGLHQSMEGDKLKELTSAELARHLLSLN
ncbi:MAG: tRNA pseudouridine synthase B [Elusimicrobia bacterium]|nr:tRNA pseudouridine synthase B [Elusimicrobiota bacterium]